MAFDPIVYDNPQALYPSFKRTAAESYVKGQLLKFGADNDTVTNVTTAADDHLVAVSLEDIPSTEPDTTRRIQVRMLSAGSVIPLKVGAAVTLGTKVVCQGTTGRIADVGAAAAADARTIVGVALQASAVAGDLVPVLIK